MDPLAEEYTPLSSYAYVANNPLLFFDPDGQRIDVSLLLKGEDGKVDKGNLLLLGRMLSDLSNITGRDIGISGGKLVMGKKNDSQNISKLARLLLNELINSADVIKVTPSDETGVPRRTNELRVDAAEMFGYARAGKEAGLDEKTMSVGLTFIHETLHTELGHKVTNKESGYYDHAGKSDYKPGNAVRFVNRIRRQMGLRERGNDNPSDAVPYLFSDSRFRILF